MSENLYTVSLWIHLLCMIGVFGAILFYQFGLDRELRNQESTAGRLSGLGNALVGIGLLSGLAVFYFKIKIAAATGVEIVGRDHMTVGIKFLLLIGVGACLGISASMARKGRPDSAGAQRIIALVLLTIASFLGVWL